MTDLIQISVKRIRPDWYEAEVPELDIVVAAASMEEICREIEHAIELEIQIAIERPGLNSVERVKMLSPWRMSAAS